MKKVIFSGLILAFAGIGVVACEKENLSETIVSKDLKNENKSKIPTYQNIDEVYESLDFLFKMGEYERRIYEQQNNSKSLLTKVYEVYEGISMENLKSQEELENYVAEHSSVLSLKTNLDRELEYRAYFADNHFSVLANENRLFIVGELCFKVFDDGLVSTNKFNAQSLTEINVVSVKDVLHNDEITITEIKLDESGDRASCNPTYNEVDQTNGKERTQIFVGVSLFRMDTGFGSFIDVVDLYGRIRPYKKTLGIWYFAQRTITGNFYSTANFNNPGTQTLTLNQSVAPVLDYSVNRNVNAQNINITATNARITSIDSWGDTPSTSSAILICN